MPANFSGEWKSNNSNTRIVIHQQYQIADIQGQREGSPVKLENQRIVGNSLKFSGHSLEINGEAGILRWSVSEPPVTLYRTRGSIEPFNL